VIFFSSPISQTLEGFVQNSVQEGFFLVFLGNINHLQSELHQKMSTDMLTHNSLTMRTTETDLRSVKQYYTFTQKYFKARLKRWDSSEEMFRSLSAQARCSSRPHSHVQPKYLKVK